MGAPRAPGTFTAFVTALFGTPAGELAGDTVDLAAVLGSRDLAGPTAASWRAASSHTGPGARAQGRTCVPPPDPVCEVRFLHSPLPPGQHVSHGPRVLRLARLRLPCPDAQLRFLLEAFGFSERAVYRSGGAIDHAELTWGDGGVMFGPHRPDDPHDQPPGGASVHVVVSAPDALYDRAVAAGAVVLRPIEDTDFGSRQFVVRDPEGNVWSFGTWYEQAATAAGCPARRG